MPLHHAFTHWLRSLSLARSTLLVFMLALLPRLALVTVYPTDLRYPDERGYYELAIRLLQEHRYELSWGDSTHTNQFSSLAYPPLLPFLLLGIFIITGPSVVAAKLGLALVASGTAILLFWIARHLFGRGAAWAAALCYAINPLLLYVNNLLFPQTLGSFLLLACVSQLAVFRFDQARAPWLALGAGISLGLLILTIPAFAPVSPFLALWLATRPGISYRTIIRRAVHVGIMAAAASAVVLPWSARNHLRHGEFILVTSASSVPFWEGNLGLRIPASYAEILRPMTPNEREKHLIHKAWEKMRENPMTATFRIAKKFFLFFWIKDKQLVSTDHSKPVYYLAGGVFYLPVLTAAILSIRRLARRRRETYWIAGTIMVTAAVYAVFLAKIRYRLTVEPLIILLGCAALTDRLQRLATVFFPFVKRGE